MWPWKGGRQQAAPAGGWLPEHAIDGNLNTGSLLADVDPDRWLEIELDQDYNLAEIVAYNRSDGCWERMVNVVLKVLDADRNEIYVSEPKMRHSREVRIPLTMTALVFRVRVTSAWKVARLICK